MGVKTNFYGGDGTLYFSDLFAFIEGTGDDYFDNVTVTSETVDTVTTNTLNCILDNANVFSIVYNEGEDYASYIINNTNGSTLKTGYFCSPSASSTWSNNLFGYRNSNGFFFKCITNAGASTTNAQQNSYVFVSTIKDVGLGMIACLRSSTAGSSYNKIMMSPIDFHNSTTARETVTKDAYNITTDEEKYSTPVQIPVGNSYFENVFAIPLNQYGGIVGKLTDGQKTYVGDGYIYLAE